jgi:HEPN domain-containing protein
MRRPQDWLRQAELDLQAATDARDHGHYEWACFLAQQAGEKAVKSAHERTGAEAWGHSVAALLDELDGVPSEALEAGKSLDRHYIPTRYPNAHPSGAPGDLYTERDARLALGDAKLVLDHVRGRDTQA